MTSFDIAGDFLASAKSAIDAGDLALASDYINAATKLVREADADFRRENIVARFELATEELDQLETLRRLLAFSKSQAPRNGSVDTQLTSRLFNLLNAAPKMQMSKGIRGTLPALEFLCENRTEIRNLFSRLVSKL